MQKAAGDQSVPFASIKKFSGKPHVELVLRDSVQRSRVQRIKNVTPDEEPQVDGNDCVRCRIRIEFSARCREPLVVV